MTDGFITHAVRALRLLAVMLGVVLLNSCGSIDSTDYTLTIAHLNDTHSHLEATPVTLDIAGTPTLVQMGGFARLQTLVDEMRADTPAFLLLHAGDALQGTLYFTLFAGAVEFDFLNRLGVDAMTFGNHEFDRGPAAIPPFLKRATFPFVSSNVDFSGEPAIAARVPQTLTLEIRGERIGIIGLTTETTPQSTLNVGSVRFLDAITAARQQVAELENRGVNKIIALTHLGFERDMKLAASVNGIDIIVGGHSHTLQGDPSRLGAIGLTPEHPYPTEVRTPDGGKTVLLHAWQWGQVLGNLRVTFDAAGRVRGYAPGAVMPVGDRFSRNDVAIEPASPAYREIIQALGTTGMARVVPEDPATLAALAPYGSQLQIFRSQPAGTAAEELPRRLNGGPGVLAADSMLAAVPHARAALLNFGGVRRDLRAGVISVGDVLEVMPFGNTLVVVDLTGDELKRALEEGIQFLLDKFGRDRPALPYVAGISFSVNLAAEAGQRVGALAVREEGGYRPVDPAATYRTVVNSFVAGGGDGFATIKNARGFRNDTGIIDSDALRDHLTSLHTVPNPREQRIRITTAPAARVAPPRPADGYESGRLLPAAAAGLP